MASALSLGNYRGESCSLGSKFPRHLSGTSLINFHFNCLTLTSKQVNYQDSDFFFCGNALLELRLTSLYDFPDQRLGSVAGLRDITTTATIDPSPKKEKNGLKRGVHWPYIVKGDGGQPLS